MKKGEKKIKVTVMGGGTGTYTVLTSLKKFKNLDLASIVSMADDGGSTGRLRDELGVLPAGDMRQCLVALSSAPKELRELFNYRFDNGSLKGHSFGNIFISALEKLKGDLNSALFFLKKILKIKGEVIPSTLDDIKLVAELENKNIIFGEHQINTSKLLKKSSIKRIFLNKKARINPIARKRIIESDFIIIGPGNLYCSLIPLFLIDGINQALKKTDALIIYIVNLMNKLYHTYDYNIFDFVRKIEEYLGKDIIKIVIFNNKKPSKILLEKYKKEGSYTKFPNKNIFKKQGKLFIGEDLVSDKIYKQKKNDFIRRSFIRHNPEKLGKLLFNIFCKNYKT